MKLTRTRGHVINMGQYESFRTEATVEVEVPEGATFTQEFYDRADGFLAAALAADLETAKRLTTVDTSYVIPLTEAADA